MTIAGFFNGDCIAGNLKMSGNTLSSTDANGNVELTPDGSGSVELNTSITNQDYSSNGGLVYKRTYNTDNTSASGSSAEYKVITGGSTQGEARFVCALNGVRSYAGGIDGADSNVYKFVTANNSNPDLSTSTELYRMDTSGNMSYTSTGYIKLALGTEVQRPVSPSEGMWRGNSDTKDAEYHNGTGWVRLTPPKSACSVYLNSNQNNVTGDNTNYTIPFDQEIFDLNNDFDISTHRFTAPEDGIYAAKLQAYFEGILSSHTSGSIAIDHKNSGGTSIGYYPIYIGVYNAVTNAGTLSMQTNVDIQMSQGDYLEFKLQVFNGTKVINVVGFTTPTYYTQASVFRVYT